ncbi:hypothetical protein ACJJTC_013614 [Scirpophaga incertulas]
MAPTTRRQSKLIPSSNIPKMTVRKKKLLQGHSKSNGESLSKHKRLSGLNSENDGGICSVNSLNSNSDTQNDRGSLKAPGKTSVDTKSPKLFSIFCNPNPGISAALPKATTVKNKRFIKTASDQYIIDAGQKEFGVTLCDQCGAIYHIGDPGDEYKHRIYHHAIDVLKFYGFKGEHVVGRTATSGRCIRIRQGEAGWKRVEALLARVVNPYIGYSENMTGKKRMYTAYLFVEANLIVGCLIMEPITKAHKIIPGNPDCCSLEEYPVKCGVSRVWTHTKFRRRGIARAMLDCARASLLHASVVAVHEVAFSTPTADGKCLATKYCETPNFYVYQ